SALSCSLMIRSCCIWGSGMERRPLSVKRLTYSTSTTSLSPTRSFLVSTPRITPCTRFGVATSMRSPRICQRRFPRQAWSFSDILDSHSFEQIIDGVHFETQGDLPVPIDLAVTLKIADSAGIQNNFCQRQRGLRGGLSGWGARRLVGPR